MNPTLFEWTIFFYDIVQVIVAFAAIVLAVRWEKGEFIPGLSMLFLYTVLEAADVFLFAQGIPLDVAQFGFILLAIIFFIVGMHPSWSRRLGMKKNNVETRKESNNKDDSILSVLRKL